MYPVPGAPILTKVLHVRHDEYDDTLSIENFMLIDNGKKLDFQFKA
jgi:hypothetical protein